MNSLETYTTGLKKEILKAMQSVFGNEFPIPELRNKIHVTWEYPREATHYPAVYLTYSEGPIRNVGIGYFGKDTRDDGFPYEYMQYRFEGNLNVNILALTPEDRDTIAGAIVNILGPGRKIQAFKSFHEEISDADYILLHILGDYIVPGTAQVVDAPYGDHDDRIYITSYSVQVFGEFFTDSETSALIQISDIELYPYRKGDPAPW